MRITIRTVPHDSMRYNTIGDWLYDPIEQELTILVSQLECPQYEQAVALHELVEALLCINDGVTQKQVDAFDMSLTEADCLDIEPGDMPEAPYQKQHCIATGIERIFIAALDLKWLPYDENIVTTCNNYRKKGKVQ